DLATRRTLTEAANQSLLTAASQTADRLDSFITSASRMVQIEALLPAFQDYLNLPAGQRAGSAAEREANALLQILRNKDPLLSYLLLDRRGQVVAATSGEELGQGKADQDYFRAPFASAEPFSSPVDFSDNPATGNLYFTQAVVDAATADTLGVLVARYDAAILQSLVVRSNDLAGPRSFGVLFDENHLQLAHGVAPHTLYKFAGSMPAERVAELQSDQRLPAGPAEGFSLNLAALEHGLNNAQNQKFFTAQEAAMPVGHNRTDQVAAVSLKTRPWVVAFFEPRAAFLAPAEEQSRNTLVFAVLMAGVMSMAALGVAQVLAGPIARLTQVAERITAGDLNARANPEGGDEIGALAVAFNTMTTRLRDLIGSLETRVTERTAQLQAAADIGRATASVRDLSQLMTLALELIRERFGFYHASIFLLDEAGEFAVVRESAGPVGAELKARGHKLGVGSNSLIGWVTQHRHPHVALDVAEDPFHFKNPLLPDTRSELAIPLIVGDRLLGALDVQSTTPNAFSESDVQVLQTLADQLSVAIENAGLFQRTQASLDELSALYRQVTDAGWQALVQGQPREMVFELEPLTRMPTSVEISTSVIVPLELRGQTVGMIELHGRRQDALEPEERTVIEAVAAQLSVALESAVLLAETQRRSRREQLINDVTFQMRSTLNPTIILQSGIRELGKALGATEVVVRLEQPAAGAKPDQNPALPAE
ncbi:MAG: GAF domain-containing protein, partial [Anaerolineales bacterium]